MEADLPHVEYKKQNKRGYTKKDYDEAVEANDAIYQRYLASKAAEKGVEINLTELMQKA